VSKTDIAMNAVFAAAERILLTDPTRAVLLDGRTFSKRIRSPTCSPSRGVSGSRCAHRVRVFGRDRRRRDGERPRAGTHPAGNRHPDLYARAKAAPPVNRAPNHPRHRRLTIDECVRLALAHSGRVDNVFAWGWAILVICSGHTVSLLPGSSPCCAATSFSASRLALAASAAGQNESSGELPAPQKFDKDFVGRTSRRRPVFAQWIGKTDTFWYAARTQTAPCTGKVDAAKKDKVPLFDTSNCPRRSPRRPRSRSTPTLCALPIWSLPTTAEAHV